MAIFNGNLWGLATFVQDCKVKVSLFLHANRLSWWVGMGDGRWDGRFPRFQAGCKVRLHHFSGFVFFERQNRYYLWVWLYKFMYIYIYICLQYMNIYIYVFAVQQMIRCKLGCVVSSYKAPTSYFTLLIIANGAHLLWFLFIVLLQKAQVRAIWSYDLDAENPVFSKRIRLVRYPYRFPWRLITWNV